MRTGKFITFEGIDGCGKSTQAQLFSKRLKANGISFVFLREPGSTLISEKIRQVLLDRAHHAMYPLTELLLYSASRHQLIKERIVPELNQGNIVICDRFYDSTTVYQGCARGLDLDFIHSLNRLVSENHKPDLTFVIDIPLEERFRRVQPKRLDRLENENDKFQQRVREGFVQLATDNPDRVRLLDGALGREELSDIIWNMFMNLTKG